MQEQENETDEERSARLQQTIQQNRNPQLQAMNRYVSVDFGIHKYNEELNNLMDLDGQTKHATQRQNTNRLKP